jgi:citronellol/citronellal dehydrogenase
VTTDRTGRTIVISGGSRGIGPAILLAAARRGADAVPLATTDRPALNRAGTADRAPERCDLGDPGKPTGQVVLDAEVLARTGITDLSPRGGTDDPELDVVVDPA